MALSNNKTDEYYMSCALDLAARGTECSPNPRVGCVLVRGGEIVGRGWHQKYGGPHAEVNAVRDAGEAARGATAYVTLEPCSHYGKTPPCADLLIERGVARVVAGMRDPNPKVDGGGFAKLEKAGIKVESGVLEEECRWMNRGFIQRMTHGRPWVTLKIAASLDGKIALENGESKWITGPESRAIVHAMRASSDAVLTGVGTVLADDPQLTVRDAPGRTPLRVILDRRLRTPLSAKILEGGNVAVFTLGSAPRAAGEALERAGARVEYLSEDNFLRAVLDKLCADGVNYLMIEAGAKVAGAFIKAGLCDELALFTAPKIMGRGPSFADGAVFASMEEVPELKIREVSRCGDDLLVRGVFACSPDL